MRSAIIIGLVIALIALTVVAASIGSARIPVGRIFSLLTNRVAADDPDARIIRLVRLPRILVSVLVGAALALAGVILQGLFKNPMADPYVVGAASGAAFGAALAIALSLNIAFLRIGIVPLAAFAGSVMAMFVVYGLARVGGRLPVINLLLAGVAVSTFLSSLVSLIIVVSSRNLQEIVFWLMGGFSGRHWDHALVMLPYLALGGAVTLYHLRELNALLLGEETAAHLGVNVEAVKRNLLIATSLLTAAAVSVAGVIGFVGLIVPHIVRLIVGPDHRWLVPAAVVGGGLFMLLADTLARTILAPAEMPVGVITSLVGGPFFIYLLRRRQTGGARA
ncbi:MAG: FecCD family ABC transporter permease [Chloroflexota bacterium]